MKSTLNGWIWRVRVPNTCSNGPIADHKSHLQPLLLLRPICDQWACFLNTPLSFSVPEYHIYPWVHSIISCKARIHCRPLYPPCLCLPQLHVSHVFFLIIHFAGDLRWTNLAFSWSCLSICLFFPYPGSKWETERERERERRVWRWRCHTHEQIRCACHMCARVCLSTAIWFGWCVCGRLGCSTITAVLVHHWQPNRLQIAGWFCPSTTRNKKKKRTQWTTPIEGVLVLCDTYK